MSKFTITVERTVTAENQADAISRFLERPFGYGATTNIVEVEEPEPAPKTLTQKAVDTVAAVVKDAAAQAGIVEQPPNCRDHGVTMEKKPSRFRKGEFYWSCSQRTADGGSCKYRPNGR